MYDKKTLDRFRNPKFSGEIKKPDAVGQEGNVKCGDIMKIFLKIDKGTIKDIKFQTYGCVAAIASSDAMCEIAKGKKVEDALKIKPEDIVKKLGDVPPIKFHCSILGTKALKNAIENYKKREKCLKQK
ncbi:iron-sulfur cluster assembly scaffold protein [Candidatus Woesearchaeota archaeon B3_Woes]|nr:MAG: iron-sulfur cluster assembly scaffold protein [Candidatus Woesearchaeota archaeon B3_Woes]